MHDVYPTRIVFDLFEVLCIAWRRESSVVYTSALLEELSDISRTMQVMRGKKQVFEGELSSLRRVKENVNEVQYGNECGVGVTGFVDWKEGDKIQAYDVQVKRQSLEEASDTQIFGSFAASIDMDDM